MCFRNAWSRFVVFLFPLPTEEIPVAEIVCDFDENLDPIVRPFPKRKHPRKKVGPRKLPKAPFQTVDMRSATVGTMVGMVVGRG